MSKSYVGVAKQRMKRNKFINMMTWTTAVILILLTVYLGTGLFIDLIYNAYKVRTGRVSPTIARLKQYFVVPRLVKNSKDLEHDAEYFIKGLGGVEVPLYPGSHFVFENVGDLRDEQLLTEVSKFLTRNSVYVLEAGYTFDNVVDFYKEELPKRRWVLVHELPPTESYLVSGLYFVKGDIGLRIYTMTGYDIWYELLTKNQAESALKERRLNVFRQQYVVKLGVGKTLPFYTGLGFKILTEYNVEIQKHPSLNAFYITIYDQNNKVFAEIIPVLVLSEYQTEDMRRYQEFLVQSFIDEKFNKVKKEQLYATGIDGRKSQENQESSGNDKQGIRYKMEYPKQIKVKLDKVQAVFQDIVSKHLQVKWGHVVLLDTLKLEDPEKLLHPQEFQVYALYTVSTTEKEGKQLGGAIFMVNGIVYLVDVGYLTDYKMVWLGFK